MSARPASVVGQALSPNGKSTLTCETCDGAEGIRTPDLRDANAALSQLSHSPMTFQRSPFYRAAGCLSRRIPPACRVLFPASSGPRHLRHIFRQSLSAHERACLTYHFGRVSRAVGAPIAPTPCRFAKSPGPWERLLPPSGSARALEPVRDAIAAMCALAGRGVSEALPPRPAPIHRLLRRCAPFLQMGASHPL